MQPVASVDEAIEKKIVRFIYSLFYSVERIRNAGIACILRSKQDQIGRDANIFGQHAGQVSLSRGANGCQRQFLHES